MRCYFPFSLIAALCPHANPIVMTLHDAFGAENCPVLVPGRS